MNSTRDFVNWALKSNQDAVNCLMDLFELLHFYDDMIDRDQILTDRAVHELFWKILVTLPNNTFHKTYSAHITPVLTTCIMEWKAANFIERKHRVIKESESSLRVAYITRSSYHNLITQFALLLYGVEWSTTVAQAVSNIAYDETFEEYLQELEK